MQAQEELKDTRTLRERALEALDDEEKLQEQNQLDYAAESQRRTVKLLKEKFQVDEADMELTGGGVIVDGVRFGSGEYSYRSYLFILGTCPRCGETVPSADIIRLEFIGKMIREFQPNPSHWCQPPQTEPEPSTAEQFITLLRQVVREEISNQGE